jgi:hypothetical protein
LYKSPSEDIIPNRSISFQPDIATKLTKATSKLPSSIELAEGMRALITWNLAVSADLTNGTQGTIEKIFLDP